VAELNSRLTPRAVGKAELAEGELDIPDPAPPDEPIEFVPLGPVGLPDLTSLQNELLKEVVRSCGIPSHVFEAKPPSSPAGSELNASGGVQ
jgi:hypothetical protein